MGYTGEDGDDRLQLVSFHSTSKVAFEHLAVLSFCDAYTNDAI